ncbi:MAG TPA: hypothetical protein ENN53_06555 [Candidatus Acetothermia bacterium]|nr:hypothetical protein [Candidatus Acetothermia bacterium]
MRRAGLVAALLVGTVGLAQVNTGWLNPSADSGQFADGSRAYYDDGAYATAPDNRVHLYWGYGISVPAGSEVVGIEVLVDARKHEARASALYVELSWDGGTSWTTTGYFAGWMSAAWRQYVLGGSTDTWGRTWSAGELGDGSFRVRLRAEQASRLNWVAVRVHYREGISQSLSVTPQLVDLEELTLADYDRGYREISPAQRLTVSSATAWSLHIASDSPTWIYTGSEPPPGKPCSHLEWRVSAFGPGVTTPQTGYVGLSTGEQAVAGGSAGTGLWLEVALRVRVDYATTVPGTYELRFTYTLTGP